MTKRNFTIKEWLLYIIRGIFMAIGYIPHCIANWATDKLNKSYYREV